MKKSYYLFLLSCLPVFTKAQLTGVVAVPSTYTSIASVIGALNLQGLSGGVTVAIASGYTETVVVGGFSLTASGTVTSPIVFQKSGAGLNPMLIAYSGGSGTPGSMNQDGVWRLIGCDYVTIDGIDIVDLNLTNPATMEFGIGLFKANSNDGCQHNTIKNCSITLNRINNSSGSGPAEDGSRGIDVVNATSSAHNSVISVTAVSGTNSHNKFYSNTIQNCNIGVSLIGYADTAPYTMADTDNDFGGNSSTTGNFLFNFGGGGSVNSAAGLKTLAQYNLNVAYNSINNNNGLGNNHPTLLRGIYLGTASGANCSIVNNTITLNGGATSSQLVVIENISGSAATNNTVFINNNVISNCTYTSSVSGPFYGIWNSASPAHLSISSNTFINNSTSAASGSTYLIYNNGAVSASINMNDNTLSFRYAGSAPYSGNMYSIYNTNGTNSAVLTINNNSFSNYSHIGFVATGALYFIHNTSSVDEVHINQNTWDNLSLNHSGAEYLIANNSSIQSQLSFNNNSIIGGLNRTASAGATYMIYSTGNSLSTCSQTISGNIFSNITATVSGTGIFYGIYTTDGSVSPFPRKVVCNNFISNVNITSTGAFYGYYLDNLGDGTTTTSSLVYGNTLSAISRAGSLYGLYSNGSVSPNYPPQIFENALLNLNSSGTSSTIFASYLVGGNAGLNFYKNKISGMYATGSNAVAHGIYITSALNTTVATNVVGHVNAPNSAATQAVNGIYINSGAQVNVIYNTVYLNAQSTGGSYNSNALYASTTTSLNLKNNIFINTSVGGSGISSAFRRSSTSLTNYLSGSNNNLFYVGVPGTSHVLFQNGATSYTTLSAFQTLVSPRESLSVSQNVAFLSALAASPNYLHITPNIVSFCEGGAVNVLGISDDFDNQVRQGNVGYTGSGLAPDIGADEFDQNTNPCTSAHAGTISAIGYTLCAGDSISLLSTGYTPGTGLIHQWKVSTVSGSSYMPVTGGIGGTTPEFYSPVLTPGTYYFVFETTCTSLSLSASSAEATVIVNALPLTLAGVSNSLVCSGQTVNFTALANSGSTFQWSGPNGFNSTLQNPSVVYATSNTAGVYYVVASLNGCASLQSSVAVSVSETTLSLLTQPNELCLGNTATLSLLTSATSYTWNNGASSSTIIVSPTATAVYAVVVTNTANCLVSKSITVSVINPSITGNNSVVCGNAANVILSVTAFTPSLIKWFDSFISNTSLGSGSSYSLSISTSTTIYAEATNSLTNCQSIRIPVTVTLSPNPSLTVTANVATICPGNSCTLTASGAFTYSWSGLGNGQSKVVNPLSSKLYTVTGKNSLNCSSSQTIQVSTYTTSNINAAQSATLVCPSSIVEFTVSGADSYIWNTGANGSVTTVTPATNTTYTVYGINTHSCVSTKTLAITTKSVPVIAITQSTNNVCAGEPVTFTATGATSYTWLPGNSISNTFVAMPVTASVYNAIGKSINTCTNVGVVSVEVNACTGIAERPKESDYLILFPNPSAGTFELKFMVKGKKNLYIFSAEGKLIVEYVFYSDHEIIDISAFSKGLYYLRVVGEKIKLSQKLSVL